MAERRVPPRIDESGPRISGRSYDSDFARLPEDETIHDLEPGATVSGRRNVAMIVMAVGFALVFATLLVQHWLALVAGLVLLAAGGVWAMWRNRPVRLSRGTGPVEVRDPGRG